MTDLKFNAALNAYKTASQMGGGMPKLGGEEEQQGPSFTELLGDSLSDARTTGYKTESISAKSIAEKAELHELVTSVTNAELTLNTVVAVRDKVLQAYQDIIKMPI
ncbi:MAG: flagellar hook-basal body complex protein FliE [Alphaproteobacteria bacterium]|nr:flagellar hook-basal body complex protein FliE [Alphaproteobacteria bacterium]